MSNFKNMFEKDEPKNARALSRSEANRAVDHAALLENAARYGRGKRLDEAKKLLPELMAYVKSTYPEYSINQQLDAVVALAALAALAAL